MTSLRLVRLIMIISERKKREQAAAPNKMKSANKETA
jgi:hypothetical protein